MEFYKVCYELNKNLSLDVKELLLITAIEEDKESFWESFWGALQGEFNEDPSGLSIMLDMGLNFIPFVGQVLDARDILACLDKLIRQKRTHEIMIWVTLVLTAIGCVPYAGDVIKAIGKAIVKGADDIIITLLKKLDAEDVYKAFIKFYNKINESTEEAIKIINQWLLEAEKRYNETDLSELIRNANEYIRKAIEFIQTKIDEFGRRVFGREDALQKINKLSEVGIDRQEKIIRILEESPKGTIAQLNNLQKGNYGEMKMDIFYDNLGYDRISLDRVIDLDAPTHKGIDGVYYNPDGHPPYIIAEAKFGSARLNNTLDGKQMDDDWIFGSNRLYNAVGKDIYDEILIEGFDKQLVQVNTDGLLKVINLE